MKKSLPCFSALAIIVAASTAIAQPAPSPVGASQQIAVPAMAPAAPQSHNAGDQLIAKSSNQLERRASVVARLQYSASVGGQKLNNGNGCFGSYWQQGSGNDLRIRLELVATQDAKLLQVSNGRFLWVDRRLPTGRSVTRYDLRQLRADPALAPPDFDKLDPGKANWSAVQSLLTAHSGGLPNLLAGLRENFSFQPPQPMQLAINASAESPEVKVPVVAVVGRWKPEKLDALLTKTDTTTNDDPTPRKHKPQRMPDRLPQEVLLLVGQANLFPYRIEYRQLETPDALTGDGPPIPYQLSVHPLVVLELSDVKFDSPIDAGQFDYAPGDADWVDQTANLLERIHKERQAQVANRPIDAPR
jgi:hypothetical protein